MKGSPRSGTRKVKAEKNHLEPGTRFGKLTVIEYVGIDESHHWRIRVKCDCGEVVVKEKGNLLKGLQSCGKCQHADIIVEPGQRFGNLTVIENAGLDKWNKPLIKVLCDCGETAIKSKSNLISGDTNTCGKCKRILKRTLEDLTGKKFGRLTVDSYSHEDRHGNRFWRCFCECGNEVKVNTNQLNGGHTQSCGCFMRDRGEENPEIFAIRQLYEKLKIQGIARGHEFNLPFAVYAGLTTQPCHYCGTMPSMVKNKEEASEYTYQGTDRIDNTKGYTPENVVPSCWPCNSLKNTRTAEEFYEFSKYIISHTGDYAISTVEQARKIVMHHEKGRNEWDVINDIRLNE